MANSKPVYSAGLNSISMYRHQGLSVQLTFQLQLMPQLGFLTLDWRETLRPMIPDVTERLSHHPISLPRVQALPMPAPQYLD